MKESKNIERLFQEKLKDLEMTPNPAVWNKIEKSMATPKKSKKRFIWWFSGSVAALLLLGFLLFNDNTYKTNEIASKKKIKTLKKNDSTYTNKDNLEKDLTPIITKNNKSEKEENTRNINTVVPKKKTPVYVANIDKKTTNKKLKTTTPNKTNTQQTTPVTTDDLAKNINPNTIKQETTLDSSKKQDLAVALKNKTSNIRSHKKSWSIAPVVSELFYNSLSNKSPVDSRLDNATKSGESSTSFGLKIAYQASKKWRIQTGIHQINLAQTTENVAVASISKNSSFANSSQALRSPTISKNDEITLINATSNNELRQEDNNNNQLRQSFGYIEIPVEINYQLFETNKLQFHLVGGVSSLFLTTNNLQIENPNYSYSDGEATNLNDVNFSFNLGTAVEYHFSNSWFFNLSPMLKMQTQTFNNTNNKPYLLGVSTGLNYKF
ncbi:porin family protein [Wenyingzhuangia marina]|uniref:Outer membrane protein beta-barrel domain-containing protein n=1 Tax=Wenyingzhuangia marina TaxID=1195760 RepID=A0A1M5SPJ4_9FLAO|nr:porin family protein [Wenyingzhuangia marina]GGF63252.1 hypothetical protein GCM10011397_02850 [Wenyingzhuangia marina]SHH40317.1 Outer membrane protein beta-barrel domain-containing protein [Wenyingzhuangia marina]